MIGLTGKDKRMLTEIHNDQKWLVKEMKAMRAEAVSEEGYKRCVRRKAAVDTLKEDVAETQKSFKWIRNTMVGGLITTIIVGCGAAANFMLGN